MKAARTEKQIILFNNFGQAIRTINWSDSSIIFVKNDKQKQKQKIVPLFTSTGFFCVSFIFFTAEFVNNIFQPTFATVSSPDSIAFSPCQK